MSGGGFLGLGPAPSAPAAPNYQAAAQETAQGNLAAARAAASANRINQVTPYGNLNYAETGVDSQGNPTYTATTSLSDIGQQLLNNQNQASLGLGGTINSALGRVQSTMGQGFNPNLPQVGIEAGQNYQDAYMQRLRPQIEQGREALDVKLANAGIPVGSEAYKRAMMTQGQRENDLMLGATTQGFGVGLQANQNAYNQAMTNYNLPLNTLSALRSGSQVQNPSFVNSAQQATTGGADILGASQMGYNAQMGDFNAKQAAQQNFNQGLMGLGAAGIMASDIRMKENIVRIGTLPNGLPFYQFEYISEFKDHPLAGHGTHTGVMAQEVQALIPDAVTTLDNGFMAVDYGKL
jgi:hypothetical protein